MQCLLDYLCSYLDTQFVCVKVCLVFLICCLFCLIISAQFVWYCRLPLWMSKLSVWMSKQSLPSLKGVVLDTSDDKYQKNLVLIYRYFCCKVSILSSIDSFFFFFFQCKGASTLCCVVECNKMWPCRAANGENNVDVNAARLRQSFYMPQYAILRQNVGLIKGLLHGIWWVRCFKITSASCRKKSDGGHWSRSTVFVTFAKNSFLMWIRSNWWHMPSNFCRAAKLQCVAFRHAA